MPSASALRLLIAWFALVALAFVPFSTRAAESPYQINVIIPLSGGGAFIGKGYEAAFRGLEKYVNAHGGIDGRPIAFSIQDDGSTPETSVQLASALIARKVPVILGAALVAECNAMAPLVTNGPVLYCLTPGVHPPRGSWVFSADPATNDMALVAVHYFRMRGITRFGVITPTDATGQDADRAIAAALAAPENRGGSIVADEHFAPTDLAANAQLERIKAARPQVLIAWATGTPFGTALRAINDVGLDVPVMTTNGNLTYAQMRQYKNFLPKELYFPAVAAVVPNDVTDPAVKAAVDSYDAAIQSVGVKPEYISSVAYDPALLVVDALRKFGTSATAAQIKSYIEKQTDWVGATGHYNFMKDPQRGLDASQAFMTRWDAAKNDWSAVSKPGGTPL